MAFNYKCLVFTLILFYIKFVNAWELSVIDDRTFLDGSAVYTEYEAQEQKRFPVSIKIVYIFQEKLKAKIVQQSAESKKTLIELADQNQAIIGINGGYYRENFLPNGLLILQGKQYSRMVHNDLLQGIVKLDINDHLSLSSREDSSNIYSAFQAGPILYQGSQWYKPNWNKVRKRSIIFEFENRNIMLMNTSAISLDELVDILKIWVTKLPENYGKLAFALNLDGGRSSAFFLNFPSPVLVQEQDYIKTAILFMN